MFISEKGLDVFIHYARAFHNYAGLLKAHHLVKGNLYFEGLKISLEGEKKFSVEAKYAVSPEAIDKIVEKWGVRHPREDRFCFFPKFFGGDASFERMEDALAHVQKRVREACREEEEA